MGDHDNLVEMGFEPRRVTLALKKTSNFNDAITWLAENEAVSIEELEAAASGGAGSSSKAQGEGEIDPFGEQGEGDGSSAVGLEAKSLKCKECGKLFNTPAKAEFHASRT